jgi:Holliday junction resolvasome RuvABC ATP-dependent DNA helicase subunit
MIAMLNGNLKVGDRGRLIVGTAAHGHPAGRSRARVYHPVRIERAGDLAAIVSNLDRGDVLLFIDGIHHLAWVVEEIHHPAMDDFELNIVVGEGPSARSMKLAVKPFTLVGAATPLGPSEFTVARPFRPALSSGLLATRN